MVPRCDNCCDMLWLEQRRTNSLGRAGCWYCLTLGTRVRSEKWGHRAWPMLGPDKWSNMRTHRPGPGEARDTHWSQARPGTETSPQRGQHYYTYVKSVRSLCRIDMSLYQCTSLFAIETVRLDNPAENSASITINPTMILRTLQDKLWYQIIWRK